MKKKIIFISLSVLVLTLCLGACNESYTDSESALQDEEDDFGIASNPKELMEEIHENCNYSIELEYDYFESSEGITYSDYISDDYDFSKLTNSLDLVESYILRLYYTPTTLEVDEYDFNGYSYTLAASTIVVNVEDATCWEYYYSSTRGYWTSKYHDDGGWRDYAYCLDDSYEYGVSDAFIYYESDIVDGDECDLYTLDQDYLPYLFIGLGTDFLFAYPGSAAYNFTHYFTYFYKELQEMICSFYCVGFTYYDYILTYDTLLYLADYEMYATIYDVGTTDDTYAYSVHDYFQSLEN